MDNPFVSRLTRDRNPVSRLFRRADEENAWIAVESLLATRDWKTLTTNDIAAALREHGVKEVDPERAKELYAQALRSFTKDDNVTDEEAEAMLRLRDLLGVTDDVITELEQTIIEPFYKQAVDHAMRDGHLSEEEKARLERIRRGLRVHERFAIETLRAAGSRILDAKWIAALDDRRLTDEELKGLEAMASNFGLRASFAAGGDKRIDRFRWMWLIESGTFPEVQCDTTLLKDEVCHWATPATLLEHKKEVLGYQHHDLTTELALTKRTRFRTGAVTITPIERESVRVIDNGNLYITSKRILFRTGSAVRVVRWEELAGVTPFQGAIQLRNTEGLTVLLRLEDVEYAMVLITSRMAL